MNGRPVVSQWDVPIPGAETTLAGRLFVPMGLGPEERRPGVVIAGPVPGVKEIGAPEYAVTLAEAGCVALTFDYRRFGASGSEPREDGSVAEHVADLRQALAYLESRRDVEPERIAVCGVGVGASYACMVAAFSPRVRAFASVAGVLDYPRALESMAGLDGADRYAAEVRARASGRPDDDYVSVVGLGDSFLMLPGEDAFRFFDRARRTLATNWRNRVSIRLLSSLLELQGLAFLPVLANRPTLFVQGTQDALSPPASVLRLMDNAGPGAAWEWVPTRSHFDLYDGGPPAQAAAAIVAGWLAWVFAGVRPAFRSSPHHKGQRGPSDALRSAPSPTSAPQTGE